MCTLVKTPDISILIDPGASIMQPGFPAPEDVKKRWLREARNKIRKAFNDANIVVISHYHHDHYMSFEEKLYGKKLLLAKNPNTYINDSQRGRALKFFELYLKKLCKIKLNRLLISEKPRSYPDPITSLPYASRRNYGDYTQRKYELLEKGRQWFKKRVERWNVSLKIPEFRCESGEYRFADGKTFRFGGTTVKFSRPLFHGIEYSRTGWVISTVVTCNGEKIIHSSDLQGPVIEDQAAWMIKEDPNTLILDGPSTYLIPYMLNLINFRRAIENVCWIIKETRNLSLIIYDHHLTREPKYREKIREVYKIGEKYGVRVTSAAEYLGLKPAVLRHT